MDVPQLPKSRPHRHQSQTPESNSSSESQIPSIPSHRPQKAETDNSEVPQLPKSRPRKIQTSDPALDVHSSESQSASEDVTPTVPKHRPSPANVEHASGNDSTHSVDLEKPNTSQSLEENVPPHIPLTRPKPLASSHQVKEVAVPGGVEEIEKVEQVSSEEKEENIEREKDHKTESETAQTVSEKSETKQEENEKNDGEDEHEEILSDEEATEKVGKVVKEDEPEKKSPVLNTEEERSLQEKTKNEFSEVVELKSSSESKDEDLHVDEVKAGFTEKESETTASNADDTFEKLSVNEQNTADVLSSKTNTSRKSSHTSAKDALAELDSLEQEIQLTSEKLSSIPTDSTEVDDVSSSVETKEVKHVDLVDNKPKVEEKEEEDKEEEPLQKEANPALPVIPKSRPKPKALESTNIPPKVPAKRPSVVSAESTSSNTSETTAAQVAHKKPPPRVPKKPSSRIAQFQEMLEQQQKADLGLLNRATPKPKPKIPVRSHTVDSENGEESKEVGEGGETEKEDFPTSGSVTDAPKVDRVNSKFAQSLNGMIGMGLPGMAFGGNPFAAIKAAKESASADSEADDEKSTDKSKVKDVRRGRARGPRGRKLPDAVKKVVEVNDATLGNKFTIVVKDLWSFDFNEPAHLEVTAEAPEKTPDVPESKEHAAEVEASESTQVARGEEEEKEGDEKKLGDDVADVESEKDVHVEEHETVAPTHDIVASTAEESVAAVAAHEPTPAIAPVAPLKEESAADDDDDEMPKTTFNFTDDEPSAAATTATSVGSILSPAGSSGEPDETGSGDLSD